MTPRIRVIIASNFSPMTFMADRFHLLGHGLAAVLLFIGAKMLLAGVWKIPIGIALGVVALVIAASIVASLLIPPRKTDAD